MQHFADFANKLEENAKTREDLLLSVLFHIRYASKLSITRGEVRKS